MRKFNTVYKSSVAIYLYFKWSKEPAPVESDKTWREFGERERERKGRRWSGSRAQRSLPFSRENTNSTDKLSTT
jgi:hypothetical protein